MWLKHLTDGEAPSYRDVGKETNRSGEAVSAWRRMERFPNVRDIEKPLSRYFGASEDWIVDGAGDPPQAELWKLWTRMRRVRHAAADAEDARSAVASAKRKKG